MTGPTPRTRSPAPSSPRQPPLPAPAAEPRRNLPKGFSDIVPPEHEAAFLAWAAGRTSLLAKLDLTTLEDEDDRSTVAAAFRAFQGQDSNLPSASSLSSAPLVLRVSPAALVPILGVDEATAGAYLDIYGPSQLQRLVAQAQQAGVRADHLLALDGVLIDDEVAGARQQTALAISLLHARLARFIESEFVRLAGQTRIAGELVAIDKIWKDALERHASDPGRLSESFRVGLKRHLLSPIAITSRPAVALDPQLFAQAFILFGNLDDLRLFVEYAEEHLDLAGTKPAAMNTLLFGSSSDEGLLHAFIREHCRELILSDRSLLYRRVRAIVADADEEEAQAPAEPQTEEDELEQAGLHEDSDELGGEDE